MSSKNPTIIEALRATCADPTLFTSAILGPPDCRISYVTGAYNFNNPTWEAVKEASERFGTDQRMITLLSLGAGQRELVHAPTSLDPIHDHDLLVGIASDCDQVDQELEWRVGESKLYYRLCVDRAMGSTSKSIERVVGDIKSWTEYYLEKPDVKRKVDVCISASEGPGNMTLEAICVFKFP